jgi:hypothetical protein
MVFPDYQKEQLAENTNTQQLCIVLCNFYQIPDIASGYHVFYAKGSLATADISFTGTAASPTFTETFNTY